MAKRKITVTVDEELVDRARTLSDEPLSRLVNAALAEHVRLLAHHDALREWVEEIERQQGPPSPGALADAEAAFEEAAGLRPRRSGAA